MEKAATEIQRIKTQIGKWLQGERKARGETTQHVADRVIGNKKAPDRGEISKLEDGLINPTLDKFFELLLTGYRVSFEEMCEHFGSEDKARIHDERKARKLLEQLLSEGPGTRRTLIELLERLKGGD